MLDNHIRNVIYSDFKDVVARIIRGEYVTEKQAYKYLAPFVEKNLVNYSCQSFSLHSKELASYL